MYLAGLIWDATNVYEDGIAVEIYVSGCKSNCRNCHNPELQDFNYGEELNIEKLIDELKNKEEWFDYIGILGGDLLDQEDAEIFLVRISKEFPNKKIFLFTGHTLKNIPEYVFKLVDLIKYGPYVEELKQDGFPASKNQKVIRCEYRKPL